MPPRAQKAVTVRFFPRLGSFMELLLDHVGTLLWIKEDYEGFLQWYMDEHDMSREEAESDSARELEEKYAIFSETYGIEASSIDEALRGVIAKINADLGKTEENAYTLETAGKCYFVRLHRSEALDEAVKNAFDLNTLDFEAYIFH